MSNVTSNELKRALTDALRRLAPEGGEREIEFNTACDCLVAMLADFLAAAPSAQPRADDDIERLVALFRQRLTAALRLHGDVAGHA